MFRVSLIIFFLFILKAYAESDTGNEQGEKSKSDLPLRLIKKTQPVMITGGLIQGLVLTTRDLNPPIFNSEIEYYSFQGVPFGEPPLNDLRFVDPTPVKPWKEIHKCFYSPAPCIDYRGVGSEDCLYLNIYTPQLPSTNATTLPVMIYIFGGAFIHRNGNFELFGPDFMIREGLVIVTMNYRLGPLGYLSTADEHVPGNAGMKDVVLALEWVQQNIMNFSGDPSQVTIVGESSGGIDVHLLLMSPLSEGLFQRAISAGGAISPLVFKTAKSVRKISFDIASSLGINTTSSEVLVNELRKLDAKTLVKAASYLTDGGLVPILVPVIEEPGSTDKPFMLEEPFVLSKSCKLKNVPHIFGIGTGEGTFTQTILEDPDQIGTEYFTILHFYLERLNISSDKYPEIDQKIKEKYFNNKEPSMETYGDIVDVISDALFVTNAISFAFLYRRCQQLYFFIYNYTGEFSAAINNINRILKLKNIPPLEVPGHGDELNYYWYTGPSQDFSQYPSNPPNSSERIHLDRMVKLFSSFIKYGDPTPPDSLELLGMNEPWPVTTPEDGTNLTYLSIGENFKVIRESIPFQERLDFWDEILSEYVSDLNLSVPRWKLTEEIKPSPFNKKEIIT